MTKDKAKEILEKVRERMSFPGASVAAWSALYNDRVHFHIRADLLFLNIVENSRGLIRFHRIRPALIQKGRTGGAELLYAKHDLVRVSRGARRGRVLPIDLLKEHEPYVPSGLSKQLEYRSDSDCFHVNRKGDVACLELLENMDGGSVQSLTDIAPELHLICKMGKEKLIARRNGSTAAWIGSQMNPDEDRDSATLRIANTCSQDAGPGMVSYPFEHFYGKGVVGAKIASGNMHFGEWYGYRKGSGQLPGIVFDC